ETTEVHLRAVGPEASDAGGVWQLLTVCPAIPVFNKTGFPLTLSFAAPEVLTVPPCPHPTVLPVVRTPAMICTFS
ncbi:MAG TPA: hypothetical protein VKD65_07460, partial [Candidatus Angelobacter sp.]|nr:hypothetical protein [Candidatus Angelobacter sp.]